jgi:hypothetical protein
VSDKARSSKKTKRESRSRKRPQLTRKNTSNLIENLTFLRRKFCYRILCENELVSNVFSAAGAPYLSLNCGSTPAISIIFKPSYFSLQGWHLVGEPIPVSSHFGESQLTRYAPYLARILAVIKHSSKIQLNCIGGEQGEILMKWLEEVRPIVNTSH